MLRQIQMHDYIRDGIKEYGKTFNPQSLSKVVETFNSYFIIDEVLGRYGWKRTAFSKSSQSSFVLNNGDFRATFYTNEYDLKIDLIHFKNGRTLVNWRIDGNAIPEDSDAFKVYSILRHRGNAKNAAIEFLKLHPRLHHYFEDLGIDPNNIPHLPCEYPPAPLTPRHLSEPLSSVRPPQNNPTQTASITTNERGQLTNPYSSTDYMSYDECQSLKCFNHNGIPLGYYYNSLDMIRYPGDQHLITIAPTGSGKNTSVQIPTLLEYDASTLVIDPKGECVIISARYRKTSMKHDVFILNPFNILKDEFTAIGFTEFHGFNPLAHLDTTDDNFVADVSVLSEALVITDSNDSYWPDSARDLISCLIMYVCINERDNRHLPQVRELITQGEEAFLRTMTAISESSFLPMAQKSRRFLSTDDRSNSSVIATAITQTLFFDDPVLAANLKRNNFTFLDMKVRK